MRVAEPPLDPSPDEARSWLRRELLHSEYHQENLLQRFLTWLQREINRGLAAAENASTLTTLATMVVFLCLLAAMVWLISRARRTAQARERQVRLLPDEKVTATELRARAEGALADGRWGDAIVDGFRALAVRQVERGRLEDSPGTTTHEVAASLAASYPEQRERFDASAEVFDLVLYGHRDATREQAVGLLALDDDLAVRR